MSALRLILADQLSHAISSLEGINAEEDVVMLCELIEEARYVKHHKKKIAFLFSAMRHFAEELESNGYAVRYIKLDNLLNTGNFDDEIKRAIAEIKPTRLIVTEPGEYRILQKMKEWPNSFGIPVDILNDTRFLTTHAEFALWAQGKMQLRMEFFYREVRKKYRILLDSDNKPIGGKWNYDKENRKPLKSGLKIPKRISHKQSSIIKEVLKLVEEKFPDHFGILKPFHYAVTRDQALIELNHFIDELLPDFGSYQDAMVAGEPYLYHSLISSYLNAGLLLPLEICKAAEAAYRAGKAPLNSVEGFIRQILGWREYIRGIYWLYMPEYGEKNDLAATAPLPDFYWGKKTDMFCVAETVRHTRDHAYSHHIQRLMITGNFALLTGINVKEVQEWYLAVYSDAYEWVEMPNTLGMALFGDGGIVASKPYAASGKYIRRMSDYCDHCRYDPNVMTGDNACPFNALYWDFLVRHEKKFRGNQRMPYIFSTWDRFGTEKQQAIRNQASVTLQKMKEDVL
ncbi:MAG: cryptochrome/photolyase family protein [Alphaproteobacteria bacterium]|nr:cryptochrome/photolyase family protein [Alphaproteobacteria bacterium]